MPYRKGPAGTAERHHSRLVRLRANGVCARCQKFVGYEGLQCAHIIRRSRAATRTDERNGWALCASCHWLVDDNPAEHSRLVLVTLGEDAYAELRAKNENPRPWRKSDWQAESARLRGLLARLQEAG